MPAGDRSSFAGGPPSKPVSMAAFPPVEESRSRLPGAALDRPVAFVSRSNWVIAGRRPFDELVGRVVPPVDEGVVLPPFGEESGRCRCRRGNLSSPSADAGSVSSAAEAMDDVVSRRRSRSRRRPSFHADYGRSPVRCRTNRRPACPIADRGRPLCELAAAGRRQQDEGKAGEDGERDRKADQCCPKDRPRPAPEAFPPDPQPAAPSASRRAARPFLVEKVGSCYCPTPLRGRARGERPRFNDQRRGENRGRLPPASSSPDHAAGRKAHFHLSARSTRTCREVDARPWVKKRSSTPQPAKRVGGHPTGPTFRRWERGGRSSAFLGLLLPGGVRRAQGGDYFYSLVAGRSA